ncbi:hypothetical protein [Pseudomonas syringae]|uniref:hypothetical protein n=1 Tax=Pseudomonas syringae TaxID=317 RepID=UPI0018E5F1A6|nr:hypothetical protein [Pseudomonas syringae]MBI6750752.1 hypothetical protein [Pseudomonas syringae]MBI6770535.1 hypothetical protein [Pseudomonas syringae]MBI6774087.1 hypothetical protein [Pseudomonas syringae]MBI6790883.1 hypothetical protein [Pseudomonas syringae]MBI6803716.1 hypothetical protein [Pseudomonas syringae]
MSKGAKPGQNRFARSQKRHIDYRVSRIKEEVIPKLKSFVGKTSFDGVTPFSRFCAELYNADLPVNEKKIGYRTLVQSTEYWKLIGPIYFKHWDSSGSMESKKDKLIGKLAVQRADQLQVETDRLRKEIEALRSAFRSHGASPVALPDSQHIDQGFMVKFDRTCRALKLVLEASEGMFIVDVDAVKISCQFNDLEPQEGLAPKELVEPFVLWMKAKESKNGDR